MNSLKFVLYKFLAQIYPYNKNSKLWSKIMRLIQYIFGWVVVDLYDIKLKVRLASRLDRQALTGEANERLLIKLINRTIKEGDVFLDIGANMGFYSIYASKKYGALSFAFEPSYRELQRIYNNLILNESSSVTVFPFGLSDKQQTLLLKIFDESNPGKNSVVSESHQFNESVLCNFAKLDQLITKDMIIKTKICKIDVEGYELHVLRGMKENMAHMNTCIFYIEMNPEQIALAGGTFEEIYDFFKSYGFTYKKGLQNREYDEIFYHPTYASLE